MLSHGFIALMMINASHGAGAGSPAPLRLTLAEAIERARDASPGLAARKAAVRAADAERRVARAGRLPQLGLVLAYTRNSDVPELVTFVSGAPGIPPRRQAIFPNIPSNYRSRMELTLPLYTGGRVDGQLEAAAGEAAAAVHDTESADADLVLEVTAAYWSLVTAQGAEGVLSEALSAFDAHLADARNRERLGLAARNEVLAVQVEHDRAELARLRAQSAADVAQANLARLLGLGEGAAIVPAEALESVAERPLPELAEQIASALASRPERAALLSRVAAADARVRLERSAGLPQLAVVAGYDYANPNRRILPPVAEWNDTWDASLSLSWSVFDGGRARAAAARATARADVVRSQLEDLERRIRLQVTQARLELGSAQAAVGVAERGLEAARESRRVAADRYREGVIGSSELLDAAVALQRAGLDRTEALAQLRLAEAGLARALGR